jgi:GntP family gluconate:H+ symporter
MSTTYLFVVIILAIIAMIIAITKLKAHPFLALLIVSIALGLATGMNPKEIMTHVESGFGNILGSVGIIVLTGGIIGVMLEKTGAALVIANTILGAVGEKRSVLAMALTGYVAGIPLFCNSGYVVLAPIARPMAKKSNVSLAVMATALSAGLFTTHCFTPLHPGTLAIANGLNANFGVLLGLGLIVAIPGTIAGVIYAKKISSKIDIPPNPEFTEEELIAKYGKLPGKLHSFSPILIIVLLIALQAIASLESAPFGTGAVKFFLDLVGNPSIALIIGMFVSMTLVAKSDRANLTKYIGEGINSSAGMLAIIGAGGSFGAILQELPLAESIGGNFLSPALGVILPFIIAAFFKTAMGATTVVQVLATSMTLPMLDVLGLGSPMGRVLAALAIAAGSMVVSHANDAYFWIVAEFSDMNTKQAYKAQTGMTLAIGLVSIIFIYLLSLILI